MLGTRQGGLNMNPSTKVSFIKIRKLIEQMDAVAGMFLLKDPSMKKTIKEQLFLLAVPLNIITYLFMMISTMVITNFDLLSVIFSLSILTTYILLYTLL